MWLQHIATRLAPPYMGIRTEGPSSRLLIRCHLSAESAEFAQFLHCGEVSALSFKTQFDQRISRIFSWMNCKSIVNSFIFFPSTLETTWNNDLSQLWTQQRHGQLGAFQHHRERIFDPFRNRLLGRSKVEECWIIRIQVENSHEFTRKKKGQGPGEKHSCHMLSLAEFEWSIVIHKR